MIAITKALLKAQPEMGNAIKGTQNDFTKKKYADLNAVRDAIIPILNKYNIIVLQPMVNIEGKNFVKTMLIHESGETIESFTEVIFSKQNDAQSQGSGITYARRYGLQSLVCIGADDDDGNGASGKDDEKIQTLDDKRRAVYDVMVANVNALNTVLNRYDIGSMEDLTTKQIEQQYNAWVKTGHIKKQQ